MGSVNGPLAGDMHPSREMPPPAPPASPRRWLARPSLAQVAAEPLGRLVRSRVRLSPPPARPSLPAGAAGAPGGTKRRSLGWDLHGAEGGARVGRAAANAGLAVALLAAYLSAGAAVMIALERAPYQQRSDARAAACAERVAAQRRLLPLCAALQEDLPGLLAGPRFRGLLPAGGNGTADAGAAVLAACPASEVEIPGCGGLRGSGRNPWTFPVAVYFCLTTVATIGFGDITPATGGGKAFVCVYAFFGVPVMILAVTELSTAVLALEYVQREARNRLAHRVEARVAGLFGKRLPARDRFDNFGPR